MAIVLDSGVLTTVALNEPLAPVVREQIREWAATGELVWAPRLLEYEFANALSRALYDGRLSSDDLREAMRSLYSVPIEVDDAPVVGEIIAITTQLARRSSYDAAYLELGQRRGAPVWTMDGRLYRNASAVGFDVRLLA